uniref:Uncharacterized protein n=1 Tax=Romanomermis culicivorax TaxID=13658 RepID=A0A915HYC5_ROMCU
MNKVAVKDQSFDGYSIDDLKEENSALRTQVALLYKQLNEKDDLLNENRRRIEQLEKTLAISKPNGLCKNEISSRKDFLIDQR